MGDVINLRKARKDRARAGSEAKAAANRLLYGQTKEQKRAAKAEQARREQVLNGAKRDRD